MIGIRVNQLVEFVGENRTERVLWIAPSWTSCVTIDVSDKAADPVLRKADEIEHLLVDRLIIEASSDPWLVPRNEADLSESMKSKRNEAWTAIKLIIDRQPAIFFPRERARAVQHVVQTTGASRYTVYRWLRRYWQRGMTPNALLPDYDHSGGPGKSKSVSEKRRGRPPTLDRDRDRMNVDEPTRRLFQDITMRYFAINRRVNFPACYKEILDEGFTDPVIDPETGQQVRLLKPRHPTLEQFRYWFSKDNDIYVIERKRRSPRNYDKDMRAVVGTSLSEVFGPASRYQIDATLVDIYLASRLRRRRIVGRPVLYVVIDVFSRMIVGIYVGYEGPSWVGAMMAIANAASDKVAYCRQFGIEITEDLWPCSNLPDVLLGDRGEMLSSNVETLENQFAVRVENTAPYRADWKGAVESRFRLLPAQFKPYTPGYIEPDFRERGARDYRLDAVLDIDQFTAIIIRCVMVHNNVHRIGGYPRDSQMIADDVQPIPLDLWEWGIARRSGQLRSYPEDMVRLSLLPCDKATVTEHGIRFFGGYYSCQMAIAEHWFERARQKGVWKVPISYEPRSMTEIYVRIGTKDIRFVPCTLTPRSESYRDRTIWEVDQMRRDERVSTSRDKPRKYEAEINHERAIKAIVAEAKAQQAAAPAEPTSNRQRVKGIRPNRAEERREIQKREAFKTASQTPEEPDAGKVVPFRADTPAVGGYELPSIVAILQHKKGNDSDDNKS